MAGAAVPARAQTPEAWLPLRGEGTVSINYQRVYGGNHFDRSGQKIYFGPIRSHDVLGDIQYGVTDRLAIGATLPLVSSKFTEAPGSIEKDHPLRSTIDDGKYRSTIQDFHASIQFNALQKLLLLTPFFAVVIPTHNYETFGHSSPGRHLREVHIGVDIGRRLERISPRAYFDIQSTYSFVESLADLNLDRVNADLEVGYDLNPRFTIRAFGGMQKTLGGLEAVPEIVDNAASEFFEIHDRAVRSHYSRIGVGVTFHWNNKMDIYGGYLDMFSAKNTHGYATVAVGVSWTFRTRRSRNVFQIPIPAK